MIFLFWLDLFIIRNLEIIALAWRSRTGWLLYEMVNTIVFFFGH